MFSTFKQIKQVFLPFFDSLSMLTLAAMKSGDFGGHRQQTTDGQT